MSTSIVPVANRLGSIGNQSTETFAESGTTFEHVRSFLYAA